MKIIKLNLTKCKVGGVKTSLVNWLSEKSSWFYAMILPLFRWIMLRREGGFFMLNRIQSYQTVKTDVPMGYNGLINIMKKSIIALMACAMLCGSAQYVDAQIGKNLVNKAKQAGQNAAKEVKQETSPDALKDAAKGAGEDAIKKKGWDETAKLFENVDSTSSILDRCRAFHYAHKRYSEATNNGANDLDFLLVYTERVVMSYILVKDIKRDDFLNSQKGLSWENPYDKLTRAACDDVDSEIFHGGKFPVEVINLANGQENTLNQPWQNVSVYIKETLDKADKCKTNEAKLVCLYRAVYYREKYTVESPNVFPTDENVCTERIKKGIAALPADLLAENPIPEVRTASELFQARLAVVENQKYSPVVPSSRDAEVEAKIKSGVLAINPNAKIKMVAFASDATAEWYIEKNALDVPLNRSKVGFIVVEYPEKPGLNLAYNLRVYQTYQGGGKYNKTSVNVSPSFLINKEILFNSNWYGVDMKF